MDVMVLHCEGEGKGWKLSLLPCLWDFVFNWVSGLHGDVFIASLQTCKQHCMYVVLLFFYRVDLKTGREIVKGKVEHMFRSHAAAF
jgi:hypothetical protein